MFGRRKKMQEEVSIPDDKKHKLVFVGKVSFSCEYCRKMMSMIGDINRELLATPCEARA